MTSSLYNAKIISAILLDVNAVYFRSTITIKKSAHFVYGRERR